MVAPGTEIGEWCERQGKKVSSLGQIGLRCMRDEQVESSHGPFCHLGLESRKEGSVKTEEQVVSVSARELPPESL